MAKPEVVLGVVPRACWTALVDDRKFPDGPCLSFVVSRVLSIGIIAGSVLVKVPQILKIVRARSAEGLSLSMFCLELVTYMITICYSYSRNFPPSTYGEYVFMVIQNVIIVALICKYRKGFSLSFMAGTVMYASAFAVLLSGMASQAMLSTLQTSNIAIYIASRVPQIYGNHMNKTTGQLSMITCLLNFLGSAARVFTTLRETADPILMSSFLMGVLLNGLLFLQILLYWNSTPKSKPKKKE